MSVNPEWHGPDEEFVCTKANKPKITPEARKRIREFVRQVQRLQKQYGLETSVQDDMIVFIDTRRTDDWHGYGYWSACLRSDDEKPFRLKNLEIEDFSAWES